MPTRLERQVFYTIKIGNDSHDVTGRKRTPKGYVTLLIHTHPNAAKNGYIMEHRVVMEMQLGRYLKSDEVVHHKNHTKHDNRISNLEVLDHAEHTILHHTGIKFSDERKEKIRMSALERFRNKKNHPFYKDVDQQVKELYQSGHMPTAISRRLGITRRTVYNKLKYLGITKEEISND
ncbi:MULTISPECIES: HNH endonuclease [unclassified Exiguobacterium]|uniref:HNH endonuclease n=1 Tax=unclassified Exiguobacterium TaxID=2644629 RepID=UPI0025C0518B|nr:MULTISPECIES: HNH endonuclease [unclassified Exiguobacterium]